MSAATLWRAVDDLVDRAPCVGDLRSHGLQLLAAQRLRASGQRVPEQIRHDEQLAAAVALTAPLVLTRVRAACDGEIAVMKGPELAQLYPTPRLRPYSDLDLLVADAPRAQRALLAAGFRPVGNPRAYIDIHHLRPLVAPGLAIAVEVHDRPKWVGGADGPSAREILATAVPSSVGVDGILAPNAAVHALLVAAHSWAHVPLVRISQLIDFALLRIAADPAEVRDAAARWGVERLVEATDAAVDALFFDGRAPWTVRTWARNLRGARERTVLESHLEHLAAPFAALPTRRAVALSAHAAALVSRPLPGETWRVKFRRIRHALRTPFARLSEHDVVLAAHGARWWPFREGSG